MLYPELLQTVTLCVWFHQCPILYSWMIFGDQCRPMKSFSNSFRNSKIIPRTLLISIFIIVLFSSKGEFGFRLHLLTVLCCSKSFIKLPLLAIWVSSKHCPIYRKILLARYASWCSEVCSPMPHLLVDQVCNKAPHWTPATITHCQHYLGRPLPRFYHRFCDTLYPDIHINK